MPPRHGLLILLVSAALGFAAYHLGGAAGLIERADPPAGARPDPLP